MTKFEQGYSVGQDAEVMSQLFSRLQRRSSQIFILAIATMLAYGHTLDVPFYFDDFPAIRDSLVIRNLGEFNALLSFARQRILGYVSFALNYQFHGYSLAGYHLINILIHFCTAVVVFLLTRVLTQLDSIIHASVSNSRRWMPLLVALLFLLHPLQTQAVTYIVQRVASLTALFYLLAILFYLYGRITDSRERKIAFFVLAAMAGCAAFLTKQNSVTLPLVLLLLEILFFNLRGRNLAYLLGVFISLISVIVVCYILVIDDNFFQALDQATQETELVSRWQYLAIQMGVIWMYIAKFVMPVSLHLDYDIGLASFSQGIVWAYTLAHLCVLLAATKLVRRYPLISFAILFYYITHLIESSIIPIRDFAFEHRTYLPNFALSLLTVWLFLSIAERYLELRGKVIVISVILVTLLGITWTRNDQWRDPEKFFAHEIQVNPERLRPRNMLGEYYLRENRNEEALETYENAAPLLNTGFDRQNNTQLAFIQNFAIALDRANRDQEALELLDALNFEAMRDVNQSVTLTLQGNILAQQQRIDEAEAQFDQAYNLDGANFQAQLSKAKILYMRQEFTESAQWLERVIAGDPEMTGIDEAYILLNAIKQNQ